MCAHRWTTVLLIGLVLIWTAVIWFATFVGPFVLTGNGFFSSWLGVLTSVFALLAHTHRTESKLGVKEVKAQAARHLLLIVGGASVVIVVMSVNGRQGLGLYALAVGLVSGTSEASLRYL